jgi:hypothetical protein
MFCPKCGSSRKTSGQRFCTRCGLNLALPRLQPLAVRSSAPTLRMSDEQRRLHTLPLSAFTAVTQPVRTARPTTPESLSSVKVTARRPMLRRNLTLVWLCLFVLPVAMVIGFKPSILASHAQNLLADASVPVQQLVATEAVKPVAAEVAPSYQPEPEMEASAPPVPSWSVIADETRLTSQAEKALCANDDAVAEIAPGGQLALAYTSGKYFGNGPGADVQISGPANERVSYTVFVRSTSTAAWQRIDINRTSLPQGVKGHDMGHHGVQQASQLLIRNNAATPLRIEAVSVIYHEAVAAQPAHNHKH